MQSHRVVELDDRSPTVTSGMEMFEWQGSSEGTFVNGPPAFTKVIAAAFCPLWAGWTCRQRVDFDPVRLAGPRCGEGWSPGPLIAGSVSFRAS